MKNFFEDRKIPPLGILLIASGIALEILVAAEEARYHQDPPLAGSGLVSAFSTPSGTLLQISRTHSKN